MAKTNIEIVKQYCDDVINKKIVAGRYCILACKRFQNDLRRSKDKDWPYYLDTAMGDQIIDFAESLVIPDISPTEDNPKRQLRLLPWMKFVYMNLFGWRYKSDHDKRRFNDAYIEVARKNSKTTSLLFPVILYDFLTTNAAESYMVSKSDDQSKKSFQELKNIISEDKDLSKYLAGNSQTVICKSSRIAFFCDGTVGIDAYKPSLSVIDEYHDYDSDRIITAFRYGGRARKNRLTIKITSAGLDISKPCYAENLAAKNVLEGLAENEQQFSVIYAYDSGDDWKNTDLLKKANPSMDELPNLPKSVLLEDLVDALEKPWHQPDYISKTCGIWTQDTSGWIPLEKFKEYQPAIIEPEGLAGLPCALAFDLSSVNDMTVLTRCFPVGNEFKFLHNFYIPSETVNERYASENVNFREWVNNGIVTATPGNVVDQDWIFSDIEETVEKYKPFALYYDPWHSNELIKKLEERFPKLLLVPFSQSLKSMSPATKDYEEQIYKQNIIDPNPVIEWMLGNVVVKPDVNGNYKPLKTSKASTKRIDGIVTSIMALTACRERKPVKAGFSSFDDLLSAF